MRRVRPSTVSPMCPRWANWPPRGAGREARVRPTRGGEGRKRSRSYDNVMRLREPPAAVRRPVRRMVPAARPPEEPKAPEADVIFQLFRHIAPEEAVRAM